jgi:hypothetical protein
VEKYFLKDIAVKVDGKEIALLGEGLLQLDLESFEILIDDILLTPKNIILMTLATAERDKELEVTGRTTEKSVTLKNAHLGGLSFEQGQGELPHIKNISFQGLSVTWNIERKEAS